MNAPNLSLRIWFVPRSGSTLLCKSLEQTGVAGKPGEFLDDADEKSFLTHYQAKSYQELKEKIWNLGTSENGVFGIKHAYHRTRYDKWISELKPLAQKQNQSDEALWEDMFPKGKHILLTRRNKVRLAVSWWKAIQDNQWHLQPGQKREKDASFYEDKYDVNALKHLFREAILREAGTQAYFDTHGILPLTVVYEDFVRSYDQTLKGILDFLEISSQQFSIPPQYYSPTADDISEAWVQRFRKDLQVDMGDRLIW